MERLVKKFEQKYRKAREEMDKWNALHSRLLNQFRNAAAIIDRLKVLQDAKNYGVLKAFSCITKELPGKQVESLETIFVAMRITLIDYQSFLGLLLLHLLSFGTLKLRPKVSQHSCNISPNWLLASKLTDMDTGHMAKALMWSLSWGMKNL
eukprot:Gb_14653 [translate_table: standard]